MEENTGSLKTFKRMLYNKGDRPAGTRLAHAGTGIRIRTVGVILARSPAGN